MSRRRPQRRTAKRSGNTSPEAMLDKLATGPVCVPFRVVKTLTHASSVASLVLKPSVISDDLTDIAADYRNWRFRRLQINIYPVSTVSNAEGVIGGIFWGTGFTAPDGYGDWECIHQAVLGLGQTVPAKIKVNNCLPFLSQKWYFTLDDGGTTEDSVGTFYSWSIATATLTAYFEIMGEIEFHNPLDPAVAASVKDYIKLKGDKIALSKYVCSLTKLGLDKEATRLEEFMKMIDNGARVLI